MNIRVIKLEDIPPEVMSAGRKSNLLFPDKPSAVYFGGYEGDKLVTFMCLVLNKDRTASIKSNFTVEDHRGKGYFTELNRHCLAYAREHGVKRILLNCLPDSVGVHQKAGARVWKTTRNITWMVYDKGF